MSKKPTLLYAGILAVLLVFALIRFPVALAAGWLLPEKIRLHGGEGTLWQGRASALGVGGMVVQQDIAWQLHPQSLLRGQLAWEIKGKFAAEHSRLNIALSPGAIELRDVHVALPLEPFLNQDAKLKPLRLGGLLKLGSTRFTPQRASEIVVRLENLFSALVPAIGALGTTEIKLATQTDQTAKWTAQPVEGALAIRGEGTFNPKRGTATGTLAFKPDEKLAGSLRPILSLLQQGANSEYTLALPAN